MTWIGKQIVDIKTGLKGTIVNDSNLGEVRLLLGKFPDGNQVIAMNNIVTTRKYEVETNEKIKHLYWESKESWLPFADSNFLRDEGKYWEDYYKMNPKEEFCPAYRTYLEDLEK
jgi:hypothetical protein